MRFREKVVILTGAGSGLGRQSAFDFAREGAHVAVTDISLDRASAVAIQIAADGGSATAVQVDVADEASVRAVVDDVVSRYGRVDVMMANAGIAPEGFGKVPFDEITIDSWNRLLAVNLTGVFLSCKHAVRVMEHGSAIVVTSSAASTICFPGMATYSATKAGVNGLVRGLAIDLGPRGIRINALCPMFGMSPNFALPGDAPVVGRSYEEDKADQWDPDASPVPLKLDRAPTLADNAAVALFLASDAAAYLSGTCLPSADGGLMHRAAFRVDASALAGELHPALQSAHNEH